MKFRVTIRKLSTDGPTNPFTPISIMGPGHPEEIGILEADNEEQVWSFWEEAKHLPRYRGKKLVKVEAI